MTVSTNDQMADHKALGQACKAPHLTLIALSLAMISVACRHTATEASLRAHSTINEHFHVFQNFQEPLNVEKTLEKSKFAAFDDFDIRSKLKDRREDGKQVMIDQSECLTYFKDLVEERNARIAKVRHFQALRAAMGQDDDMSLFCDVLDPIARTYTLNAEDASFAESFRTSVLGVVERAADIETVIFKTPVIRAKTDAAWQATSNMSDTPSYLIYQVGYVPIEVSYADQTVEKLQRPIYRSPHRRNSLDNPKVIDEVFKTLDPVWADIQLMTPENAALYLGNRNHQDSDSITLFTFTIPKSSFAIGILIGMYVMLFDIAIWLSAYVRRNSAVDPSLDESHWSLLLRNQGGLLATLLTIGLLPICTSAIALWVYYHGTVNRSLLLAVAMASAISLFSAVCVRLLIKIRNEPMQVSRGSNLFFSTVAFSIQFWPALLLVALPFDAPRGLLWDYLDELLILFAVNIVHTIIVCEAFVLHTDSAKRETRLFWAERLQRNPPRKALAYLAILFVGCLSAAALLYAATDFVTWTSVVKVLLGLGAVFLWIAMAETAICLLVPLVAVLTWMWLRYFAIDLVDTKPTT